MANHVWPWVPRGKPRPPEVPEPKESEEQVVKEEKVESAGLRVQEH